MHESAHGFDGIHRNLGLACLLGLIFLVAVILRVWNLDWGLPFRLHPDEWKYVSGGANACLGQWNPGYFRNPPGFSFLNAFWFPLWVKIHPPVLVPDWLGIEPKWLQIRTGVDVIYFYRPFDLVLGARVLSALLGSLTVMVVFGIGKEFFSRELALGGALWAAVSFAAVRESHFAVNDPASVFLLGIGLLLGLRAYRLRRKRWFYSAACFCGVAIAFKYNTFPALLAVIGLRFFGYWQNRAEEKIVYFLRDVGIVILLSAACFLLICPFPITDPFTFFGELAKLRDASRRPWQGQDPRWPGIQLLETIWISEGALVSLLALGGLGIALARKMWVFLLFPVLYILLLITHPLFFVRFTLPLLPWVSLAALLMISFLLERIRSPKFRIVLCGLLIGFATIQPLLCDGRHNFLLGRTDTRVELMYWLKIENQEPLRVTTDQFAIPLVYRGIADVWTKPFDPRLIYLDSLPSSELDQIHLSPVPIGYMAVSDFVTLPGYLPDTYEQRRNAIRKFTGNQAPVRVFQPFRKEWIPRSGDSEDAYSPFRHLWDRDRPGPVIEIYGVQS